MKPSKRFNKLKIKLITVFNILFRYEHWLLISLDSENLKKLIADESYGAKLWYHGLVKYNVKKICKNVVADMDDIDWLLEKAKFEAEAEIHNKNK